MAPTTQLTPTASSAPLKELSSRQPIELLAPARNYEVGKAAIDAGADAVYIGPPLFGARQAVGNSIEEIGRLCRYAHLFGCRVWITLNTLLTDEELPKAVEMAWQVYEAGADGLLIQDMGLLEHTLPPLRLHASTQCDNSSAGKVEWLSKVGFKRVVLARELNIREIASIHEQVPEVELEAFVHGALCVSYSGQCYMSEAVMGRSANRGCCAQMCRQRYDILDANQQVIQRDTYALSLMDMDRSAYLRQLLNAGVRSLKIEGRLKDAAYVRNITAYYRQHLDALFSQPDSPYCRASKGEVSIDFEPDPQKTFHRGATPYLFPASEHMANMLTPKSTGETIGRVVSVRATQHSSLLTLRPATRQLVLSNGDGLSIGDLGVSVNGVNKLRNGEIEVLTNKQLTEPIAPNAVVCRNLDKRWTDRLQSLPPVRKIRVAVTLSETPDGFCLTIGEYSRSFKYDKQPAKNAERAMATMREQLSKLGDTVYEASEVRLELTEPWFVPIAELNRWRRETISEGEKLAANRREKVDNSIGHPALPPTQHTDYRLNVMNRSARQFYARCGAEEVADAFEKSHDSEAWLMTCRYCLLREMGHCRKISPAQVEPAYLRTAGRLFQLRFNCSECRMSIREV